MESSDGAGADPWDDDEEFEKAEKNAVIKKLPSPILRVSKDIAN